MTVHGISHLTFIVRDLERMAYLLCHGLGAIEIYDSKDKNHSVSREKFFELGGIWIASMEGTPPAERSYQHVAFQVDESDLQTLAARLRFIGVDIEPARPRIDGEGESLYFYDFDNHLFELHCGSLTDRLNAYKRNNEHS